MSISQAVYEGLTKRIADLETEVARLKQQLAIAREAFKPSRVGRLEEGITVEWERDSVHLSCDISHQLTWTLCIRGLTDVKMKEWTTPIDSPISKWLQAEVEKLK